MGGPRGIEDQVDAPFFEGKQADFLSVNFGSLVLLGRKIDKSRPTVAAESLRSRSALDESVERVAKGFGARSINVFNMHGPSGEADENQAPLLGAFVQFKWSKMIHADFEPRFRVSVETAGMQGCGGWAQSSWSSSPAVETFGTDFLDRGIPLGDEETGEDLSMSTSAALVFHLPVSVSDDQLGERVVSRKSDGDN
jgi:hypothetical protein